MIIDACQYKFAHVALLGGRLVWYVPPSIFTYASLGTRLRPPPGIAMRMCSRSRTPVFSVPVACTPAFSIPARRPVFKERPAQALFLYQVPLGVHRLSGRTQPDGFCKRIFAELRRMTDCAPARILAQPPFTSSQLPKCCSKWKYVRRALSARGEELDSDPVCYSKTLQRFLSTRRHAPLKTATTKLHIRRSDNGLDDASNRKNGTLFLRVAQC